MRKDIALITLIVVSLALMVVPLSPALIDFLIAVNITLAVMLLMVAVYLKHPSEFSTFPSVILIGTAFRLALSIATTRLILTEAEAGDIIETFGDFVVAGSIAVGLVIFLIITVVQFIVVTKGAERVAEVGARFALDALPGKQLSIDAEARAGNLTPEQAAVKRLRLDRDSRFFGAMDGAMKFVKGDAIAGVIIILINLIGGVAVGMTAHGFSFSQAVAVFSLLTIGDGLVAQIPALLMSLCAGIIITRAEGQEGMDLGTDISAEVIADPRVPAIGAPIVMGIGLIPGFPTLIFFGMAGMLLILSTAVRRSIKIRDASAQDAEDQAQTAQNEGVPPRSSDRVTLKIATDLSAELDMAMVAMHVEGHLHALYEERGVRFAVPCINVGQLNDPRAVQVNIDEVPVHSDILPAECLLIVGSNTSLVSENGDFGEILSWPLIDGLWVSATHADALAEMEIPATSPEEGLAGLLFRVYERNLGPLFSHSVYSELIAEAFQAEPELMEQITSDLDQGSLHKIFRYLVEDGVPLRPVSLLVSSMRYWLTTLSKVNPVIMAECLRDSMKRQLCHRISGSERVLGVALIGPHLETTMRRILAEAPPAPLRDEAQEGLPLPRETNEQFLALIRKLQKSQLTSRKQVAIVVSADLRRRVRNYLAANNIQMQVLAPHEISNDITTFPVDLLELSDRSQAAASNASTKRNVVKATT